MSRLLYVYSLLLTRTTSAMVKTYVPKTVSKQPFGPLLCDDLGQSLNTTRDQVNFDHKHLTCRATKLEEEGRRKLLMFGYSYTHHLQHFKGDAPSKTYKYNFLQNITVTHAAYNSKKDSFLIICGETENGTWLASVPHNSNKLTYLHVLKSFLSVSIDEDRDIIFVSRFKRFIYKKKCESEKCPLKKILALRIPAAFTIDSRICRIYALNPYTACIKMEAYNYDGNQKDRNKIKMDCLRKVSPLVLMGDIMYFVDKNTKYYVRYYNMKTKITGDVAEVEMPYGTSIVSLVVFQGHIRFTTSTSRLYDFQITDTGSVQDITNKYTVVSDQYILVDTTDVN